ncbi:MAG: dihydroorotate dehydrogenase, partial [Candidatus Zixiibacteriota bacterium]
LVHGVRNVIHNKTLIVKLTPNVTDIALPAQAAIDGGADAISLINTLRAMAIDLTTWQPKLGNQVGGLSGQAIHPVAVYMVHRCYTSCCRKHGIPIIGMGGVSHGEDALELILAGATCVGIGTAMFREESIFSDINKYLSNYLHENNINNIANLVGKAAGKRRQI